MTVTYLGPVDNGTGTNTRGVRRYVRKFKLDADKTDDAYTVGSNASLPKIGDSHPSDTAARCEILRVEHTDPYRGWTVTAEYSSELQNSAGTGGLNNNPTLDVAQISWGSEQFQRPLIVDKNGDAVVNSAGDPFDPPAMIDDSRRVVTVQKNLTAVPTWILDYQDAVNNDAFSVDGVSIAIGQAKMQLVTVGPVQERNGTLFRQVNFQIQFQRDGWAVDILDAGFREKDPADSTKRIAITLDDGTDPSTPVLLNGSGSKLDDPTPATAQFISFDAYKERAFSSLPLT
jgi:hypothetical protein